VTLIVGEIQNLKKEGSNMHIKKIYKMLSEYFGEQGWWHADSLFEICVGIILVQRTTWKNAAKGIKNLKKRHLLKIKKIVDIPLEELRNLLRPTGFYRQKAEYLKVFSQYTQENYSGDLEKWFKKSTEDLRKELLQLKGIGEETADSILLYAAQKPVFVVDVYTRRILERMGAVAKGSSSSEIKTIAEKQLPPDLKTYKELRALFVEVGKRFCKVKPHCEGCPLESVCQKRI
jgi:endonuclease-3 related protein